MTAFKILCVALSLALAAPAFAKSASRTRLLTSPNPAKLGQTVKLVGEVDGFGGGAPTGTVNFTDGDVALGAGTLSPYGAGQATLTANMWHVCALTSAGGAACWGRNSAGEVGDGTTTRRLSPVAVTGLSSGVVAISAGGSYSCALTTVGGVKCWGVNYAGQLGDGTTLERHQPVAVSGLSTGVVAIAAGSQHSCALTAVGGVECWGSNYYGQLGDGTTENRHTPVTVSGLSSGVVAISAGQHHSCALTSVGSVKCWGGIYTNHSTVPVAVPGLSSGVAAIASGFSHACALTSLHGVKCWGTNNWGELGDGTRTNRSTPVEVSTLSTGVVAIAGGQYHTCALKGDGALFCWGSNDSGQVGDRTTTTRDTPVAVPGHTRGVAAIAPAFGYTCVSMVTGVVRCWGFNASGRLGDGTTRNRRAPKPIPDFTALVRTRAPLLTKSLGAGTHTLRATYSGDAAHSQSSGSRAQTIAP
ncbi:MULTISPECIES: Ig-like domain repeat protein [Methylosinus]|uniref:Chromosome condensation regulator RCC1 n=1 Tax=Methylosinus trichosporium (strain ATCC 35070 / NCIMB 11131 / UNIQEM 75 / OB3b) TaxID=595536 RepID=A0A2D2CUW8_METT3|nr:MULTISPECIES: Ig-like domain repeat protein [Methylosinus]ATQ66632.1 chromosome condensation regulator RCC1 [Methylosinus trichosporium OB3b]OBS51712.1 hypothetical protein A8B73_14900 [Methylosinus sp. 3S-1]